MAITDETIIHGGIKDTETNTQKYISHQTSTVRKAVTQVRPPVNQTEAIICTLFPKQ